ncbi:TonB-linked outer membrane protein, SusC/RagA family [Sinomicrobium oceani]|uniref:TonB-linked outer membrane protein, SusC/RagA family n=1 Tax=Sinomicrobium oceani TaxID=1150368 RepID=A0A1K1QUA7_9FLAO|nr:SusC/RagA family TonB-linked outer membrane protein [Sinomicrobium oceani]SFW63349.1 TonB-linked outer membrane protein, SusC/RagA family [Sinomicrobium oceani]
MRTKLSGILTLFLALMVQIGFAQEKTISGTVTDTGGMPLPGANVVIKGTSTGTQTDFDGNFTINASEGQTLQISYIGMKTSEVRVGSSSNIAVQLEEDAQSLDEVVVTALGIKREKKSLGYASQEVSGEKLAQVPVANMSDALSGTVAGLNITQSGTMGGSTNIVLRGVSSLVGNNQALIVIDGTPINNETFNQNGIGDGGGGYDYGNGLSDVNPNDIADVNVLKGAAATALYGSRGMNGVIMITTKKGRANEKIGVQFNSAITVGTVNKKTLPKYQNQYGGGYGGYSFYDVTENGPDINGDGIFDDNIVYTYDDASFGSRFDPNKLVYNWDSQYPQLPGYLQPTPFVAGASTPNDIWGTATTYMNSVSFSGGDDKGTFRMAYTNFLQEGALRNSDITRNTIDFSATYNLTEKLSAFGNITYTNTKGQGRVYTGYEGRNPMQGFRQWWNMSVDMQKQKEAYLATGQNMTWNLTDWESRKVGYADNHYFDRDNNYQSDRKNRFFGNFGLNYEINDWMSLMGRFTFDTFSELREERVAAGSSSGIGRTSHGGAGEYYFMNHTVSEYNYDMILNIDKDLNEDLNLNANVGWNLRVNKRYGNSAQTNGGLKVPGLYSITNTANPLTEEDMLDLNINKKVDGFFGQFNLGWRDMVYLGGSVRTDRSSALPVKNNRYWYPSGSVSFVFSELLDSRETINFGKFRFNYARVGNDTDPYQLMNTYAFDPSFNGAYSASAPATSNNPNLKSETMEEFEAGLEMNFFASRLSFDLSVYQRKTFDLITNTAVSGSSGFTGIWVNSGDIENKGIEARVTVVPVQSQDFRWEMTANWAKNENKVTRIFGDNEFLLLGSMWNTTVGAQIGESTGTIRGYDFVYDDATGQKVVGTDGKYLVDTSDSQAVIGDANPDWIAGLNNSFTYKNLNLSFLIDIKHGGDVYSQDMAFGLATGLYPETAGLNELGNPKRDPVSAGGGVLLPGVKEDGTTNDIRADYSTYYNPDGYYGGSGGIGAPEKMHVYDASYVKLRNISLSYNMPKDFFGEKSPIDNMTLSLIGRNLWIIHKNLPYADPESGMSAGNIMGFQNGSHPSFKEIGASLKIEF